MAFGGVYLDGYNEFLSDICDYGWGVFALAMVHDARVRNSLRVFSARNPDLFATYSGRNGDISIKVLTKTGFKRFSKSRKQPTSSDNWFTLFDYLVVNSFLHESAILIHYKMNPRFFHEVGGKKIALFSLRWGILEEHMDEADYIIGPPVSALTGVDSGKLSKMKPKYVTPVGVQHAKSGLFGG